MKIYRINPAVNAKGNFIYKMVAQHDSFNWFDESWEKINSGVPLNMKWNWGCKTKKVSDLIPATSPGILLSKRASSTFKNMLEYSMHYSVTVNEEQTFNGFAPINYRLGDAQVGHLLSAYPQHSYTMVSESFKRLWEKNNFTGAAFEEVGEISDAVFA